MGSERGSESEIGGAVNMRTERCAAVVVAAGRGTRMGGSLQKQFLDLGGKPLVYYALKCLQDSEYIDEIILVTGAESIDYCRREIIEKFGLSKVREIAAGGRERYDSVYEGLKRCQDATMFLSMTARGLF